MTKRIYVALPVETINALDRVAPKGNRSHLISEAVSYFAEGHAKRNLAGKLKAEVLNRICSQRLGHADPKPRDRADRAILHVNEHASRR